MANVIYNSFKSKIGTVNWDDNATTAIYAMLVTSSYTPDIDNHEFKDDIVSEVTGTGYTAGGNTIDNRATSVDTVADISKWDGDDVVWASSTITARGAVVYKDTGDPSTSPLIAYIDFGEDKSSSLGDFIIQWHTDGVLRIS